MAKRSYKALQYTTIILIITALITSFLYMNRETTEEIIEKVVKIDHSKEIREVLDKFDSIYYTGNREANAVGSAVVITYKGQVVFTKCFGVKKAGENDSIDVNTIFRLASVSKTITGVLAGILAEEKLIDLDEKVLNILPEFRLAIDSSTQNVTVRHLLSHSSGLVPHAFDMMVEDHVPFNQIFARLNEAEIAAPPGTIYAYQNVMYSVFAPVIEAKVHKPFNQVMKEKIFEPFGMKNASLDFESFSQNPDKAFPHQQTGNQDRPVFTPLKLNNRYYTTAPAAGVNASISDMGQFLLAISSKDDDLFSEEARKITYTPQIESILKRSYYRSWGALGIKFYALGWRIIHFKNHTIAQHSGFVQGYQSEIAVCPESEIGIAVLTNSPNSHTSTYLPAFLSLFFDHQQKMKLYANLHDSVPETFNEEEVSN